MPPADDLAGKLLANAFPQAGPPADALSDPLVDTPMLVVLGQLRPYELNPRVTRNPLFDEIKASIDSTILDALYGWDSPHSNFNLLMGLNNSFGDMLLNFVMATMFIILPSFWITALTWAGLRTGDVLRGLSEGTTEAKSAGRSGTGIITRKL